MVKISEKELDVLKHQRVARFATIMENGFAHVVPMIYAFNGENIYIATPLGFKKLKNLVKNKKVTVLVDEYSENWDFRLMAVVVFGEGKIYESGEEFNEGRRLLYQKYFQHESVYPIKEGEQAIIKVIPLQILSWDYAEAPLAIKRSGNLPSR